MATAQRTIYQTVDKAYDEYELALRALHVCWRSLESLVALPTHGYGPGGIVHENTKIVRQASELLGVVESAHVAMSARLAKIEHLHSEVA